MKTTGPAPMKAGDTETRLSLMATVRFTGSAGWGWLAYRVLFPQPVMTSTVSASHPMLIRVRNSLSPLSPAPAVRRPILLRSRNVNRLSQRARVRGRRSAHRMVPSGTGSSSGGGVGDQLAAASQTPQFVLQLHPGVLFRALVFLAGEPAQ